MATVGKSSDNTSEMDRTERSLTSNNSVDLGGSAILKRFFRVSDKNVSTTEEIVGLPIRF